MVASLMPQLSSEQQLFIEKALQGENILVDACIGSGKTTAIQHLCNELPSMKRVLYLTYNRLLKLDAKSKIKNKNVTVTNYHGFAYMMLNKAGISVGISDLIQTFIREKPTVGKYDVLIIDEYQDIEQELAELLQLVKGCNTDMQIIAVGDMEQKIYDKTTLNVESFMKEFLEEHLTLRFTQCFRLSNDLAAMLGRVWKKQIRGVNDYCKVEEMAKEDVVSFLAEQNPADILCLGARKGAMADTLNLLEETYSYKFNKRTVYATISDNDSMGKTEPEEDSAIFTTYDSSKGLERKICVVFDFTESYWGVRISKPQQSYTILRNIFCVAASRGKKRIIFVKTDEAMLSEKTLSTFTETNQKFVNLDMSEMFEFKYKEDVEKCFSHLEIQKLVQNDSSLINVKSSDDLIDLSPCIGIYQEAVFFDNYQIDAAIRLRLLLNPEFNKLYTKEIQESSLDRKILFLVSLETKQSRYRTQVVTPLVNEEQSELIKARLKTNLNTDEKAQVECQIDFSDKEKGEVIFSAIGFADVVKSGVVYELKFVSELTHEHFLQCASYMVALNLPKGILWNTRDNASYEIRVPDRKKFLDAVTETVTKGMIENYYEPVIKAPELHKRFIKNLPKKKKEENTMDKFAVIDTETNWDGKVMSIGVVVADSETKKELDSVYYIIDPEYKVGGMFSYELRIDEEDACVTGRKQALKEIKEWLATYGVQKLFAYNASFDKNHLPEYSGYEWYDIMRLAAYRQYNSAIPDSAECFKTGKLKRGYSVENVLRMISKNKQYSETHNAVLDARDELEIMQLLGHEIKEYNIALISDEKVLTARLPQSKAKVIHKEVQKELHKSIGNLDLFKENGGQIYKENKLKEETDIGKTEKMNCGMRCTIIEDHGYNDIAVRFEDGTMVEHTNKAKFVRGTIVNPNRKRGGAI
ncbi:MAG: AAA family ATPase [Roseburia sp.]|nr:AAA family ATPase [Roseburia sp.]